MHHFYVIAFYVNAIGKRAGGISVEIQIESHVVKSQLFAQCRKVFLHIFAGEECTLYNSPVHYSISKGHI